MNTLLAIEWLKIKKYRTFWIIVGLFAIMLPLWNYGISNGLLKLGGGSKGGMNVLNQVYSFSQVWQNIGFWASLFIWFLSILVIILTTNEYQFRTNRQNVIDGWSRLQFYHAKWYLILALSIATTIYVFLVGMSFAVINDGFNNFPGKLEYLFYTFVLAVNYYGFAVLLSILFKRSGLAIGMFILYCMFIENLLKSLFNHFTDNDLGNYMPLQASDELLPFPMMDMLKNMAGITSSPSATTYAIVSVLWICLYYFIGRKKLLSSDW
jgi:hypothetical protein